MSSAVPLRDNQQQCYWAEDTVMTPLPPPAVRNIDLRGLGVRAPILSPSTTPTGHNTDTITGSGTNSPYPMLAGLTLASPTSPSDTPRVDSPQLSSSQRLSYPLLPMLNTTTHQTPSVAVMNESRPQRSVFGSVSDGNFHLSQNNRGSSSGSNNILLTPFTSSSIPMVPFKLEHSVGINFEDKPGVVYDLLKSGVLRDHFQLATPEEAPLSCASSLYGHLHVLKCTRTNPHAFPGIKAGDFVLLKWSSVMHALRQRTVDGNHPLLENVYRGCLLWSKIHQDSFIRNIDTRTHGLATFPSSNTVMAAASFVSRCFGYTEYRGIHFSLSEYHDGKDLFDFRKKQPLTDEQCTDFGKDMCCAVFFCHAHSVVHHDISPENFVLHRTMHIDGSVASVHLCLIDFGVALRDTRWTAPPLSPKCLTVDADVAAWSQPLDATPLQHAPSFMSMSYSSSSSSSSSSSPSSRNNKLEISPASAQASTSSFSFSRSTSATDLSSMSRARFLHKAIGGPIKPGKAAYMLPELRFGRDWDRYACDLFSLGVSFYFLVFGDHPHFDNVTSFEAMQTHPVYMDSWLNSEQVAYCRTHSTIKYDLCRVIHRLLKPQHLIPRIDEVMSMAPFRMSASPKNHA